MFKQVVMLPQNEFRKLLSSKTSEKETIFRNVFQTFEINDFQDKIYNDCKIKIREIEEKTTILNTLISRIDDEYKELASHITCLLGLTNGEKVSRSEQNKQNRDKLKEARKRMAKKYGDDYDDNDDNDDNNEE